MLSVRARSLALAGLLSLGLPAIAVEFDAQPCTLEDASSALSGQSLLEAAQQGLAGAQYQLALSLDQGDQDFPQDAEKAAYWYQQAANQGHACAQYNLAVGYEQGLGLVPDAELAVLWYRRAANQGDRDAQFNLALAYEEGAGVEANPTQALHWFHQAADGGDAEAQFQLGHYHALGRATAADPQQARAWYAKAAAQQHQGAVQTLKKLEQSAADVH